MDSFPQWERPRWLHDLTPEKLQEMPSEEVYKLLLNLLHRTKQLPECPHKKYLVKLGTLCISIQKMKLEYECIDDDERKAEIDGKMKEAIETLMKLMVMKKAEEFANDFVEIEDEDVEDPWGGQLALEDKTAEKVEDKNKIGDYDPWAIE